MIRGISFLIPNTWGKHLNDILSGIDLKRFSWRIGDGEILSDSENYANLFIGYDREISGNELKNLIENKTYYTIFADLQAYPKGEISAIKTYEDFVQSKCEIALIIIDNIYAAIYCKNKEILNLLLINAQNAGFTDISYITDDNDFRTQITAW